jgi:hypothetical protein
MPDETQIGALTPLQPEAMPNVDPYLQALASVVQPAFEFDITLLVGGFLVSGILVGEQTYFDGFASEFATTFPEEDRADVKKMLTPNLKEVNDPRSRRYLS